MTLAEGPASFAFTTTDRLRIVGQRSRMPAGDGDVIFIHGFSMSRLCWGRQMCSDRRDA